MVASVGEPFVSGFDPASLGAELARVGYVVIEECSDVDLLRRYDPTGINGLVVNNDMSQRVPASLTAPLLRPLYRRRRLARDVVDHAALPKRSQPDVAFTRSRLMNRRCSSPGISRSITVGSGNRHHGVRSRDVGCVAHARQKIQALHKNLRSEIAAESPPHWLFAGSHGAVRREDSLPRRRKPQIRFKVFPRCDDLVRAAGDSSIFGRIRVAGVLKSDGHRSEEVTHHYSDDDAE